MVQQDAAPYTGRLMENIVALGAAVDGTTIIGEAPFIGVLTEAALVAVAAITGDATNNRVLNIVNKKGDGTGTTVMATLTFGAANNAVAFVEKTFILSAVAGATVVAEGDILACVETHGGTGLANPGGRVILLLSRQDRVPETYVAGEALSI